LGLVTPVRDANQAHYGRNVQARADEPIGGNAVIDHKLTPRGIRWAGKPAHRTRMTKSVTQMNPRALTEAEKRRIMADVAKKRNGRR